MAKHGPIDDSPDGLARLLDRGSHGAVAEDDDPLTTEHEPSDEDLPGGMLDAAHEVLSAIHGKDHAHLAHAMHNFMTQRDMHAAHGGAEEVPGEGGDISTVNDNASIDGE